MSLFLKITKDFGGLSPLHRTYLYWVSALTMYLATEVKERYAPINKRRMLKPYVGFPFNLYFHIRSSNKNISFINAEMGAVQGVVHIFPTTWSPLLQF